MVKCRPGKQQASQSHLCAQQIVEQIILKAILRNMENKELIGEHQDGFTKSESCLTN